MADHVCGCAENASAPSQPINISEPERYASAIAGGFLLAMGFASPSNLKRLTGLMAGGGLIYRGLSGHCMVRNWMSNPRKQEAARAEAQLDETIEESFPASDPPAYTASAASRSRE